MTNHEKITTVGVRPLGCEYHITRAGMCSYHNVSGTMTGNFLTLRNGNINPYIPGVLLAKCYHDMTFLKTILKLSTKFSNYLKESYSSR